MGGMFEFNQPLGHEATKTSSTKAKTILDLARKNYNLVEQFHEECGSS